MRIVLDTNILVRAAVKGAGPAAELLEIILGDTAHRLILSPFLLRELERVFGYDRVRSLCRLADKEIANYLVYLRQSEFAEMVFPGPAPRVVPADVEDDPVVHTAVIGQADALCTLNRHFFAPAFASTASSAAFTS